MNSDTTQPKLLSAKQLGEMLTLSKRQIHRLNSCGKIPAHIKIGAAVRWHAEEIAEWLKAGAPDRKTWDAIKEV